MAETATATPDDGALTIDAFCEKYSTSRATAYREIASGALIAKKRGRNTLIPIHSAGNGSPHCRKNRRRRAQPNCRNS